MSKLIKYVCSTCGGGHSFKTDNEAFKHGWKILAYNIAQNLTLCVCPECLKAKSVLDRIKEVKKEETEEKKQGLIYLNEELDELEEIEDELLENDGIEGEKSKKKYLKFD